MIFGKRIRLRAIEREDLPRFAAWLNDPEVRQYIAAYLPMSLVMEERWFEDMLARSPDEHPLVIEVDTPAEYPDVSAKGAAPKEATAAGGWLAVGNISLMHINTRARSAEVGIFIGEKRFWNQGYGTEAMRLMLRHGFNSLNLHRIFLRVNANNLRGIRAYEKAGYILEGRLRQDYFDQGEYSDTLIMSVLRPEWQEV